MIDVEQHGVETMARLVRIETLLGVDPREEVPLHKTATRIGREFPSQRDKPRLMPLNYWRESFHDDQRVHRVVGQHGSRGVSKPKTAHHHIPFTPIQFTKCQPDQLLLHEVEQAGHEKGVAELYLINIDA